MKHADITPGGPSGSGNGKGVQGGIFDKAGSGGAGANQKKVEEVQKSDGKAEKFLKMELYDWHGKSISQFQDSALQLKKVIRNLISPQQSNAISLAVLNNQFILFNNHQKLEIYRLVKLLGFSKMHAFRLAGILESTGRFIEDISRDFAELKKVIILKKFKGTEIENYRNSVSDF